MKLWVTGGAGYIGSVAVERLLQAGHTVTVIDHLERGHRAAVDPRARLLVGDLRDRASLTACLRDDRPDAVMHFAAYALVGESVAYPERYFENNVAGCAHLAAALSACGVRKFIFSSTCAVYGLPERNPITEDTPCRPVTPYGASKRMCENLLDSLAAAGKLEPVFLRYFNACGATSAHGEDHEPETHLIPNVLRAAGRADAPLKIFGTDYDTPDGTCIRDYIHVADLVDAHIRALRPGITGAYNLGAGRGFSVREVIDAARRVTSRPIAVEEAPRRPGDPPGLVAAAGKARRELGWVPRRSSLDDILRDAWTWMQRHPGGYGPA